MTERWRCFVAAPLDDAIRVALSATTAAWRREPPADGMRWADPDAWHLTLAFLGSISHVAVPVVSRAIGDVAATHRPFRVETGRIGAFHRPGSARTLWYGVGDSDATMASLAADLVRALGLRAAEPYRPHITIARARGQPVDLRGWIEPASMSAPSGHLDVRAIHLMRSHLGRGRARYETLASFVLRGVP